MYVVFHFQPIHIVLEYVYNIIIMLSRTRGKAKRSVDSTVWLAEQGVVGVGPPEGVGNDTGQANCCSRPP